MRAKETERGGGGEQKVHAIKRYIIVTSMEVFFLVQRVPFLLAFLRFGFFFFFEEWGKGKADSSNVKKLLSNDLV